MRLLTIQESNEYRALQRRQSVATVAEVMGRMARAASEASGEIANFAKVVNQYNKREKYFPRVGDNRIRRCLKWLRMRVITL